MQLVLFVNILVLHIFSLTPALAINCLICSDANLRNALCLPLTCSRLFTLWEGLYLKLTQRLVHASCIEQQYDLLTFRTHIQAAFASDEDLQQRRVSCELGSLYSRSRNRKLGGDRSLASSKTRLGCRSKVSHA